MNDEMSKEAVAFVFRGGKKVLGAMFRAAGRALREKRIELKQMKNAGKIAAASEKAKEKVIAKANAPGKVRVKDLMKSGEEVSTYDMHDQDVRRWERELKKNGIQYSVQVDKKTDPPTYVVFFKTKNVDILERTLTKDIGDEMSGESQTKNKAKTGQKKKKREPVIKPKLEKYKAKVKAAGAKKSKTKTKQKVR